MFATSITKSVIPAFLVGLLALPAQGAAQPARQRGNEDRRAALEEKVELMLIWQLTDVLGLDEESGRQVLPIIKKYNRQRRKLVRSQQKLRRRLRQAITDEDEEKIEALLAEFRRGKERLNQLVEEEISALEEVLTTTQLAKYILFRERFERQLREIIFQARHQRRGPRMGDDHPRPPKRDINFHYLPAG